MSCTGGGFYNLWRTDCGPTLYPSLKTAQTVDVTIWGFIFAACILFFSFLIIVPGYRGKEKWFVLIRSFVFVFVTTSILVCNFGQDWEVSSLYTKTPYRAGLDEEIHADIGVHIGLRSINITLRADPVVASFKNGTHEERIDYNERYSWNDLGFAQGRNGFGPFAGLINRQFRASQWRGTPWPILWIAEYFTIDGEGIRWGRHYRQAGWFTHIMVWLAFPLWIIANMLPYMVIQYAGIFSILTGTSLLLANLIFGLLRNPNDLSGAIPFEDGRLEFAFGWCYWLNLGTCILCLAIGVIILVMDRLFYKNITSFFGVDIFQDLEEIYADASELQAMMQQQQHRRTGLFRRRQSRPGDIYGNGIPLAIRRTNGPAAIPTIAEDAEVYEDVESPAPPLPDKPVVERRFRRRGNTNTLSKFSLPLRTTHSGDQDLPSLPAKKKQGAHAMATVQPPPPKKGKGAGKKTTHLPPSAADVAIAGPSHRTGPTLETAPKVKPKPIPRSKPGTPATEKKPSPPQPPPTSAKPDLRKEGSGRSQQENPQDVLSGSYDNNYENQDEIQAMADAHQALSPLQRIQQANARL